MAEIKLQAQKRTIIGSKVKNLRKEGLIPANVYGKKTKSISVTLKKDEFKKVFNQAGETGVVQLSIADEKEQRPILIQNIQTHPVTDETLHVDLRQIILTEKVTAKIPVEIIGESPAVAQKLGILIQPVSEIEVDALPMDLPEKFIVDVTKLIAVGDEIKVKDLDIDRKKLELKAEDELTVAKIDQLAAEEVVAPPVTEEVPVEGKSEPKEEKTA
jgi:large subunit ribosomal protein L25